MVFSARAPEPGDALTRLSWQDFEHLLAEHYRAQGYRVELVTAHDLKALGQTGLDMRLFRGSESTIVQCGQWDAIFVDLPEVQKLMSAMLNEAASRGVLVTRGAFTPAARNAVLRQPRVHLVDGEVLRAMLKLPDHLDTAPVGTRPAEKVAQTAAAARRRSGTGGNPRSLVVPAIMGVVILGLLGLFGWRAMSTREDAPPSAAASASPLSTASAAPAPARTPPPVIEPAPAPASAPLTSARAADAAASDGLAHELAERERVRREDAAANRKKAEDAMKVMERNTREVGSYQ